MMSRLSRLALDAFTIISSFFFLSAVTDGRKGSQDPTRLLEIPISSMASHTGTLFLSPAPGFWTRLLYLYNDSSYTRTWELPNIRWLDS